MADELHAKVEKGTKGHRAALALMLGGGILMLLISLPVISAPTSNLMFIPWLLSLGLIAASIKCSAAHERGLKAYSLAYAMLLFLMFLAAIVVVPTNTVSPYDMSILLAVPFLLGIAGVGMVRLRGHAMSWRRKAALVGAVAVVFLLVYVGNIVNGFYFSWMFLLAGVKNAALSAVIRPPGVTEGLLVDPGGTVMYIMGWGQGGGAVIEAVNLSTGSAANAVWLGSNQILAATLNPVNRTMTALAYNRTNKSFSLVLASPSGGRILPPVLRGNIIQNSSFDVALNPATGNVYISDSLTREIYVVGGKNMTLLGNISVPLYPSSMAMDQRTGELYALTKGELLASNGYPSAYLSYFFGINTVTGMLEHGLNITAASNSIGRRSLTIPPSTMVFDNRTGFAYVGSSFFLGAINLSNGAFTYLSENSMLANRRFGGVFVDPRTGTAYAVSAVNSWSANRPQPGGNNADSYAYVYSIYGDRIVNESYLVMPILPWCGGGAFGQQGVFASDRKGIYLIDQCGVQNGNTTVYRVST